MVIEELKPGLFIQTTATGNHRIVKPIKKRIDEPFNFKTNCNYKNLLIGGSWSSFFTILFIISIMMLVTFGYAYDTKQCREIISDPIGFCKDSNACDFISPSADVYPYQNLNFTNTNEHYLLLPP